MKYWLGGVQAGNGRQLVHITVLKCGVVVSVYWCDVVCQKNYLNEGVDSEG